MVQHHPETSGGASVEGVGAPFSEAVPLVSVNMPVYNCEPYIRRTLDALLAQTFTDWECVVVDDASTDRTAEIAQSYAARDGRIRVHRLDAATKLPYPYCRNVAVEHSRGKWVAFLDGDDWWEPWKLSRQVALLQASPKAVFCATGTWFWKNGRVTGQFDAVDCGRLEETLPLRNAFAHPSVMLDRQAMIELGMYDLKMRTAQDWDLWLKILWRYGSEGFVMVDEPAVFHRMHDRNVSNNTLRTSRFEWLITRRVLAHDGWGLKRPVRAWRVLGMRFALDAEKFRAAGRVHRAMLRAMAMLALHPLSGWRWRIVRATSKAWLGKVLRGSTTATEAPEAMVSMAVLPVEHGGHGAHDAQEMHGSMYSGGGGKGG